MRRRRSKNENDKEEHIARACKDCSGICKHRRCRVIVCKNETARKLATQAYGKNDAWSAFADFVYSVVGVYALYPECTDEEFEELFKLFGFEIEEGEDG